MRQHCHENNSHENEHLFVVGMKFMSIAIIIIYQDFRMRLILIWTSSFLWRIRIMRIMEKVEEHTI